jgi:hypothetical protein
MIPGETLESKKLREIAREEQRKRREAKALRMKAR